MIVDIYGRKAGSEGFLNRVEPLPYLFEEKDDTVYVCFEKGDKVAIHKISTDNGVKKVEFGYGKWESRTSLRYQPINGVNCKLEVDE